MEQPVGMMRQTYPNTTVTACLVSLEKKCQGNKNVHVLGIRNTLSGFLHI